ncbi:MAG: hypothetical protein K6E42_03485 [Synergistes sp.]|nr:hypothetical protein [Synergistes sp.]
MPTTPFPGLKPVPVLITSTVPKYGREDIRRFPAWITDEGDYRRYILVPTVYELKHDSNFEVGVGCVVNDRDGEHLCVEYKQLKPFRRIHPSLLTKRVLD